MRVCNTIVLASLNPHKFLEFKDLFAQYPELEILSVEGLIRNPDKLDLVETHDNYLANSMAKARLANRASHYPSLGDDSGLEVAALDGRPGVRTRRYASPKPGQSQDQANIEKLLSELHGKSNRQARFVATLSLVIEGVSFSATGVLEGTIAEGPRGAGGFGYDPIFIPKGSQLTLAEMSATEKNSISHRGRAVQELMLMAKARGIQFAKP